MKQIFFRNLSELLFYNFYIFRVIPLIKSMRLGGDSSNL
jgi:hypothetical protein